MALEMETKTERMSFDSYEVTHRLETMATNFQGPDQKSAE